MPSKKSAVIADQALLDLVSDFGHKINPRTKEPYFVFEKNAWLHFGLERHDPPRKNGSYTPGYRVKHTKRLLGRDLDGNLLFWTWDQNADFKKANQEWSREKKKLEDRVRIGNKKDDLDRLRKELNSQIKLIKNKTKASGLTIKDLLELS